MQPLKLPGDRYTEEECKELAEKFECPVSNICRYCGEEIKMMAYTMTGSCCVNHEKLRYNPSAYDQNSSMAQFILPERTATDTSSQNGKPARKKK